jgi:hypothetical protein
MRAFFCRAAAVAIAGAAAVLCGCQSRTTFQQWVEDPPPVSSEGFASPQSLRVVVVPGRHLPHEVTTVPGPTAGEPVGPFAFSVVHAPQAVRAGDPLLIGAQIDNTGAKAESLITASEPGYRGCLVYIEDERDAVPHPTTAALENQYNSTQRLWRSGVGPRLAPGDKYAIIVDVAQVCQLEAGRTYRIQLEYIAMRFDRRFNASGKRLLSNVVAVQVR